MRRGPNGPAGWTRSPPSTVNPVTRVTGGRTDGAIRGHHDAPPPPRGCRADDGRTKDERREPFARSLRLGPPGVTAPAGRFVGRPALTRRDAVGRPVPGSRGRV